MRTNRGRTRSGPAPAPSACGSRRRPVRGARRADHFFLYFTLQPYGLVVAGDTALPSFSALTAFTT